MDEEQDASYTRQVGLRLRSIRRQKQLSLHDVEAASGKEFKASVLGAYERGERAISVPRLQRLASFYGVPVDQLLPPIGVAAAAERAIDLTDGSAPVAERRAPSRGITIDLSRLDHMSTQEAALLSRYVAMIKAQRYGFSGTELTMRREDLNALAVLLDTDVETVKARIEEMGFEPVK